MCIIAFSYISNIFICKFCSTVVFSSTISAAWITIITKTFISVIICYPINFSFIKFFRSTFFNNLKFKGGRAILLNCNFNWNVYFIFMFFKTAFNVITLTYIRFAVAYFCYLINAYHCGTSTIIRLGLILIPTGSACPQGV